MNEILSHLKIMTNTEDCQALCMQFHQDIDKIAATLVGVFGLTYEKEVASLDEPLLRWMDFRLRHIDPHPRKIFVSDKFPKKLPPHIESALHKIEEKIINGTDINPYQGKGLTIHNDTSSVKRQRRTDLLWADWGIHHIHLTDEPLTSESYFSKRSDFLLFFVVGADFVLFIDIRHHSEEDIFVCDELVDILFKKWPGYMAQFELKGLSAGVGSITPEERNAARKGGISPMLTRNGKVYMSPGGGITTASTSTKVSLATDKVHHDLRNLAESILDPDGQFKKIEMDQKFSLVITPRGFSVFDEKSKHAWIFPERKENEQDTFFTHLRNVFTPPWVMKFLNANRFFEVS